MQAVILAGGLATRLGARTAHTPKSMLEVAGRPFIAWQLDRIHRSGIDRVILCIGHLGGTIAEFVGDGSRFGLAIAYSDEGESLLGTAGALRHALPLLDDAFLVTYGDSFLPFDYSAPLRDLIGHAEALGTMSVFRNAGRWEASNVRLSGDGVEVYAKGTADPSFDYVDYGATALRRDVIEPLPSGIPVGLDRVQADLAARGLLRAHIATQRFYEIGSPAGLAELDGALSSGTVP
jgi:NDP-sugar pyrophosphorylase family protein